MGHAPLAFDSKARGAQLQRRFRGILGRAIFILQRRRSYTQIPPTVQTLRFYYRTAPQRTMSMEVADPLEGLYTATKARFMVSLMPSSCT